jgi:hypothetical protein
MSSELPDPFAFPGRRTAPPRPRRILGVPPVVLLAGLGFFGVTCVAGAWAFTEMSRILRERSSLLSRVEDQEPKTPPPPSGQR